MSATDASSQQHRQPRLYEIRLEGHLDARWAGWFEGLSLTRESNGTTVLSGPLVDQAALHGVLRKVRDAGLPLLSVSQIHAEQPDAQDAKP